MRNKLILILTTRCNFKCKHCLRGYYDNQYDLSLTLVKKALEEAKELGFKHIALTGGEPVLYPEFNKIVDYICKLGFTWSIVSNGSLYKKYDKLIDKHKDKLKFLSLSLDGGTEKTHDYIRQKGSFKKVCEATAHYLEKGVFVRVAYTVNSKNLEEIPDFVKLTLNLGVKAIKFGGIIPADYNSELLLTWSQKTTAFKYINELKKKEIIPVDHATSLYTYKNEDNFCGNIDDHEPAINAYGEYIFCCDTIGQGAVLGTLKEESFSDLYIKGMKKATWLKRIRRERIEKKQYFKGFNSCQFCNKLLKEQMRE